MCLQDLQLGRNRYYKQTPLSLSNGIPQLAVRANSLRVAISLSITGGAVPGSYSISNKPDVATSAFHSFSFYSGNRLIRIEDFGILVVGDLWVLIQGGDDNLILTEILTDQPTELGSIIKKEE